jgi:hypothetical protein
VNSHTGATVVLFRLHKRRPEIAAVLQALVNKHPTGPIYIAWDNARMQEDEEIEAVVRAAAGRLVLLYLPTDSPWLNPIEMVWRQFRRAAPLRNRLEGRKHCVIVLRQGDYGRAYAQGKQGLALLESIGYCLAEEIRQWLASLPVTA